MEAPRVLLSFPSSTADDGLLSRIVLLLDTSASLPTHNIWWIEVYRNVLKKDQELVGLHLSHGHCRGDEPSKRRWVRYPHPPPPHRKRKRFFAELGWLLCSSRHWHRSPPFPQTDLHLKECSAISHGYVSGCANSTPVWTPAAKVSPLPTLWSEMETKWWQWVTITTIYALNRTFLSKSSICLEWSFIKEYSL